MTKAQAPAAHAKPSLRASALSPTRSRDTTRRNVESDRADGNIGAVDLAPWRAAEIAPVMAAIVSVSPPNRTAGLNVGCASAA